MLTTPYARAMMRSRRGLPRAFCAIAARPEHPLAVLHVCCKRLGRLTQPRLRAIAQLAWLHARRVSAPVLAPYPLPLARQPRVVILDMAAVHRYDLRRIDRTVWSAGVLAVGAMKNVILSGVAYLNASNATTEYSGLSHTKMSMGCVCGGLS